MTTHPSKHSDGAAGIGWDLRYSIFVLLLLVFPLPVTDFFVSGGIVPVSFVLFYFLLLYPSLFIVAYWIVIPYTALFYWLSGLLAKKLDAVSAKGRRYALVALTAVLCAVSLSPLYVRLRHGQAERQNIIALFYDEWRSPQGTRGTAR